MMKGRRDHEWRARLSVAQMRTWAQTMKARKVVNSRHLGKWNGIMEDVWNIDI